jgi:cytochrome c556
MIKKLSILAASVMLGGQLFAAVPANSSPELQADMKKQEEALGAIQKGLLYGNKDMIKEGVAALKNSNKAAVLKDSLQAYLPENKKALYKQAMKSGEGVNKNADALLANLDANKYGDTFTSYGKILNDCNTCHLVVRGWK